MARWGGRDFYFGVDFAAAQRLFLDPDSDHEGALARWLEWRAARSVAAPRAAPGSLTVVRLAESLFDDYTVQGRLDTARWYRKHLARWLGVHGMQRVVELTTASPSRGRYAPPVVALLNAYAADLAGSGRYSPRTINHDITAVKRLFNYGADTGRCPAVHWRPVRRLPVPRSAPEALEPGEVAELLARAEKSDARLGPWLRLSYYALLRPSEAVAVINAVHAGVEVVPLRGGGARRRRADARGYTGHFLPVHEHGRLVHPRGLYELAVHKTLDHDHPRVIALTDPALDALSAARPVWSRQDGYAAACRSAGTPGAPHILRDSAASRLRALGAARADVDALLGHAPSRVSASYIREAWPHLRRLAARLAL